MNSVVSKICSFIAGISILVFAYYLSTVNYFLFHALAEGFTIVVSLTISIIVFNNHRYHKNIFISILGIAYFFTAAFDTLHTVGFYGMNILSDKNDRNLAIQLWIIARYFNSVGMLLACLSFNRTFKLVYIFAAYLVASFLLLNSLFYWGIFPKCFHEDGGLSLFKIYSEYIICLFFTIGAVFIRLHKGRFQPKIYRLIITFVVLNVCTELMMTTYFHFNVVAQPVCPCLAHQLGHNLLRYFATITWRGGHNGCCGQSQVIMEVLPQLRCGSYGHPPASLPVVQRTARHACIAC